MELQVREIINSKRLTYLNKGELIQMRFSLKHLNGVKSSLKDDPTLYKEFLSLLQKQKSPILVKVYPQEVYTGFKSSADGTELETRLKAIKIDKKERANLDCNIFYAKADPLWLSILVEYEESKTNIQFDSS